MTANECILGRRSIRKFKSDAISKEVIEEIVKTASFAPSWKNTQITRYIAVTGETKAKLSKCTKIWAGNGAIMENAPVVMAICAVKNRCGYERDGSFSTVKKDKWEMFDAGIATQTLALAAYEKGLGTVIMGLFDEEDATKVLEIPEDQYLVALVALGVPDEAPQAPKRKEVTDLLKFM